MNEIAHFYHHQGCNHHNLREQASQLRSEIAYMEARLLEMGYNGDCAYERAMAHTFRTLLDTRRRQLATLS